MMFRENLPLFGLVVLLFALYHKAFVAMGQSLLCSSSSFENLANNCSYPFRLERDPHKGDGDRRPVLACEKNSTILLVDSVKYYVQELDFVNLTIRLIDPSLDRNACSIPHDVSFYRRITSPLYSFFYEEADYSSTMYFINCILPTNSPLYVDFSPCIGNSSFSKTYFYAYVGNLTGLQLPKSCSVKAMVPTRFSNATGLSVMDINQELLQGFELKWLNYRDFCNEYKMPWYLATVIFIIRSLIYTISFFDNSTGAEFSTPPTGEFIFGRAFFLLIIFILGRALLGILCFTIFLIYKFRRRHLSMDDSIEEFLQSHNLIPIRYSYSQIKTMTKGFKDKLGQGGYGSVFKGNLQSGYLVAVKVLSKSNANGQDFMNEVATIGRIHHVNVVQLIGFCAEGSKQALVYEFMPNGSLDKFIFPDKEKSTLLTSDKIYEIALGVARGIEYLHRGCDIQILHFDIKPHNILLDENFIPKVSDFGLAKLYPIDDSIVSLTAVRGTLGYIAPELFYKNIGGISYKADVYSFGMLLMEMVGRRKNLNAFVERSSRIYFPSWIYDKLDQGEDLEVLNATEDEKKSLKKMMIVAFWCIQMKPINRPSMSNVLEMLEGPIDLLQMPPKPFFGPEEMSIEDHTNNNSAGIPTSSSDVTVTLDIM